MLQVCARLFSHSASMASGTIILWSDILPAWMSFKVTQNSLPAPLVLAAMLGSTLVASRMAGSRASAPTPCTTTAAGQYRNRRFVIGELYSYSTGCDELTLGWDAEHNAYSASMCRLCGRDAHACGLNSTCPAGNMTTAAIMVTMEEVSSYSQLGLPGNPVTMMKNESSCNVSSEEVDSCAGQGLLGLCQRTTFGRIRPSDAQLRIPIGTALLNYTQFLVHTASTFGERSTP